MLFGVRDLTDPWDMAKDGKAYLKDVEEKDMRK
jgi:hypothetical protein